MRTLFLTHFPGDAQFLFAGAVLLLPISVGVFILYLLTLQNTLKRITPQNRLMPPEQVWLTLIPLFGLVWHFIVVNNISLSIQNEFNSKDQPIENKPAFGVGLAMCIFFVITSLGIIMLGPVVFLGMIACICWLIYWKKIGEYKNKLLMIQDIPIHAQDDGTDNDTSQTNIESEI